MARNGHFGRLAKSAGFRRNPQKHAGTGAIRQEKTPTENGWGFIIGGAEEDRTPDLRIANATLSHLSYRPERRAF